MAKKSDPEQNLNETAPAAAEETRHVQPAPPPPEIKMLPLPEGDPEVYPGLILTLMPKVMGELAAVGKDQMNKHQGYAYRSIDSIYDVLNPVLARNGITVVWAVLRSEYHELQTANKALMYRCTMDVMYRFYAPDGSYVTIRISQEAHDTSDKASSKALSNALKYMAFQTFMLRTQEAVESDQEHIEANNRAEAERAEAEAKESRAKAVAAAKLACAPLLTEMGAIMNDPTMIWPDAIRLDLRARLLAAGCNIDKVVKLRDEIKAMAKELFVEPEMVLDPL